MAAGVGVATLAPTAAMVVAITFGVASTGTAIVSLSGAAATNAALAWLGGGALTAGGAGMAGGQALLALAGPIGWAIGGVSLIGAGFFLGDSNKKQADEIEKVTADLKKVNLDLKKIIVNISYCKKKIKMIKEKIEILVSAFTNIIDYTVFSENEKYKLMKLANFSAVLSQKIREKIVNE